LRGFRARLSGDDDAMGSVFRQQKSPRGTMCPRICCFVRAASEKSKGAGKAGCRLHPQPRTQDGRKTYELHSPQGLADIRLSLHDGPTDDSETIVIRPAFVTIATRPFVGRT
jgi:hypothetical protein